MSTYSIGVFYAVFTGLCWAILAIGLKYTVHFVSSGTIAWARMVVAFSCLLLYFLITQRERLFTVIQKPTKYLLIGGIALAFNYYSFMKCVELTTASNAQVMIQLGPLTLLLAGVFYFKEKMFWTQWIGVIIASLGFIFFNWDQLLVSFKNTDKYIVGNLWILGAAITWTIFAVIQKIYFKKNWTPQMYNLFVYGFCVLALFPTADIAELTALNAQSNHTMFFILFLLGLNTLFAYGALGESLSRIPASTTSLIISTNPIVCISLVQLMPHFGLSFIDPEPITFRGYLGAGLVVVGVALAVSIRPKTR